MKTLLIFGLLVAVCALAVYILPVGPYGKPRGCGGGALECALEKERARRKKEHPDENTSGKNDSDTDGQGGISP